MLDTSVLQPPVCAIHVADNDRDMLKRAVVAARISGDRPAARGQVVRQLDRLLAQPQSRDPSLPAYAGELRQSRVANDVVGHFFEGQDVRIESERAIHVVDGDSDRGNGSVARVRLKRVRLKADATIVVSGFSRTCSAGSETGRNDYR